MQEKRPALQEAGKERGMATQADRSAYSFCKVSERDTLSVHQDGPPKGPVTLSEVLLQDLRVERAHAHCLHLGEDVTLHLSPAPQPILYSVLEGSILLDMPDEAPVTLYPGDNALIFYGDPHQLGQGPKSETGETPDITPQLGETVTHRRVGQGPQQALVLQSVLELTYLRKNAHVSRAAPDLMVLRSPTGPEANSAPLKSFPFFADQLLADLEGPGALALASAFANMQLCYALKQWTSRLWGESIHDIRCPNMRRVATVVREINAHPDRAWTVPKLARHVGLSRSAFAAAFQEVIGEPPITFLTRTRMERAATLLRTDSLSMYEIGQRVGYPIESSFARAFKRHWGIAPRSFSGDDGNEEGSLSRQ